MSTRIVIFILLQFTIWHWCLFSLSATPSGTSQKLTIAAAADLKFALHEILQDEPHIEVTYGSTGNLFAQILNHAPFDLFLSADSSYCEKLVSAGLADQKDIFLYAEGKLVLWVLQSSPLSPLLSQLGMKALLDSRVQKISIANPAHAPYGKAAIEAMSNSGISVKEKWVLGENIVQASQFVETGNADIGILALSIAKAPPMEKKGKYWIIPSSLYSPLRQSGVLLKASKVKDAANRLRHKINHVSSRKILEKYGLALSSHQP